MFGTSILVAGPFQVSSAGFRWGDSGRFETRFETPNAPPGNPYAPSEASDVQKPDLFRALAKNNTQNWVNYNDLTVLPH